MGYKVDYGVLRSLAGAYGGAVSQWNSGMSSVMGQASAIVASTNIAGNSADRVKAYLDTAYSCVNASLSTLLGLFQQNFLLYMDAYTQQVDAAGDTHIEEEELSELHSSLETQRGKAQQIALAAETAIQGISDLVSLPGPDFNGADTAFGSILTSLDDLNSAVNGVESAHVSSDFSQIDALISNLDAHLMELLGQSKEFKAAFSAASYAALASVPALLQATDDAYNQLLAQEPAVTAAAGRLEAQLALEQAEVEKRQQQAKWFKIGIYAAVAIGSAVVIAACPAASPVVIGMASGLITSTASASADEYVKHGFNFGEWDKGRIGAHACIGTVTGMIGGAVGSEAGIFVKATVKGISGALEGAATTSYDQLATYGKITDTKAILVDAAVKGGSSFAGSLVGGAIAKNTKSIGISSLDKAMDDPLSKAHGLSVFLFEGGKSLGTGVVSRGVSNLTGQAITLSADGTPVQLSELDLASVSEDMFSPESMGKDFVVSGAAGAAGDYVELRTPDPDTGLTPIIQYKLGNTTDPDTGLTPIVQDSLSHIVDEDELSDILGKMEERNPSTGAASVIDEPKYAASFDQHGENTSRTDWQSIDWGNTSSTPEDIKQFEEVEQNGEFVSETRGFEAQDKNSLDSLGQKAVRDAWANEAELVRQGKGSRDWTVSQQEELLRTGKVSGFEGQHMMDKSNHPEYAGDKNNIQFLTYEEHFYGAHDGNFRNETDGRYDPATGEMHPFASGEAPTQKVIDLTDTIDPDQIDVMNDLGHDFGYGRGQDAALSRERHKGEKSNGSIK